MKNVKLGVSNKIVPRNFTMKGFYHVNFFMNKGLYLY